MRFWSRANRRVVGIAGEFATMWTPPSTLTSPSTHARWQNLWSQTLCVRRQSRWLCCLLALWLCLWRKVISVSSSRSALPTARRVCSCLCVGAGAEAAVAAEAQFPLPLPATTTIGDKTKQNKSKTVVHLVSVSNLCVNKLFSLVSFFFVFLVQNFKVQILTEVETFLENF